MPDVLIHAPGTVCWLELGTTDPAGARAFYGHLFGWQPEEGAADAPYTQFNRDGVAACGAYTLTPEQVERGAPPHWLPALAVESADAAAARTAELGGAVLEAPSDTIDPDGTRLGRGAILADPTGARFSVWEAHAHPGFGAPADGAHGSTVWIELATRDVDAAVAFYTALFGYTVETMSMPGMRYTTLHLQAGDAGVGGIHAMGDDPSYEGAPALWKVYFAVDDTDAVAAEAAAAGGQVIEPPDDIPSVGRFAVLKDPQGAYFSILKLLPMENTPPA